MKRNRLVQAQSKVKYARLGIIPILIFVFGLLNVGCSKNKSKSDDYYIKYEVKSSTIYIGGKLNIELTNENNQKTTMQIPTRTPWEAIIGPVKKGFNATLKVNEAGNNYGQLKIDTQISVSKNDSPFAIKEINNSNDPRTSVEINYKIDY
jgi:DnaJ-class molecular chaperone